MNSICIVTTTVMKLLTLVKSTCVSLKLKMLGEMNTAQIMVMSIVTVHSMSKNVTELGTVLILKMLLLILLCTMIPTWMVLSVQKIILNKITITC